MSSALNPSIAFFIAEKSSFALKKGTGKDSTNNCTHLINMSNGIELLLQRIFRLLVNKVIDYPHFFVNSLHNLYYVA